VLPRLLRVQQVVLACNQAYIASAAQSDASRTEPPFQSQVKAAFLRSQALGGDEDDPMSRAIGALGLRADRVAGVETAITRADNWLDPGRSDARRDHVGRGPGGSDGQPAGMPLAGACGWGVVYGWIAPVPSSVVSGVPLNTMVLPEILPICAPE
jgi:hypothetical protein